MTNFICIAKISFVINVGKLSSKKQNKKKYFSNLKQKKTEEKKLGVDLVGMWLNSC
jgi:hypothetical protein